uniref:Uncharacterized protein n=1 Tax=viral metagenome TaxID=1070528 RepID=A0A6C0JX38_9ZZZZ
MKPGLESVFVAADKLEKGDVVSNRVDAHQKTRRDETDIHRRFTTEKWACENLTDDAAHIQSRKSKTIKTGMN